MAEFDPKHYNHNITEYSLQYVLNTVTHIIKKENLIDPNNDEVIILNHQMSTVLNMPMLAKRQLSRVLLYQMQPLQSEARNEQFGILHASNNTNVTEILRNQLDSVRLVKVTDRLNKFMISKNIKP